MKEPHKFVVVTTVHAPTKATAILTSLEDFKTVVVADMKTPSNWFCPETVFLSVDQQLAMRSNLAARLPWHHYSRKMLGYLYSISQGAEVIIDVDDDNYPKEQWGFPEFEGDYLEATGADFVNIYSYFTEEFCWPRGYPIELLQRRQTLQIGEPARQHVGVWQSLADQEPDVDAIYRMIVGRKITFNQREPVVVGSDTIVPFNSQNTAFRKEVFPLLYLPVSVSFRFTDILRGLVAQPILWMSGYRLGFSSASVVQERNEHDLMDDFMSEIPMYQNVVRVVEITRSSIKTGASIASNMLFAYRSLADHKVVQEDEIICLEAWLRDIKAI